MTLVDESSTETVYSRTYPPGTPVTLDEEFELGVTYRTLVIVGDEAAWNRTVYDYESYELAVTENGSLRVDTFAEV